MRLREASGACAASANSKPVPFEPENLDDWNNNGLMTLIQRSLSSAERSFHELLTALQKHQRTRGFVPHKLAEEQTTTKESGFVPAKSLGDAAETPTPAGFVPQKTAAELEAFEYMGYFPEDAGKYVESVLDSGDYLPDSLRKRS